MNISIITSCNNNCEYCFQKDYHALNQVMPYEMFEDILRWGRQEKIIGLLGGEPTLHPDIIKMILLAKKQAKVSLFTNLLCKTDVLHELINLYNIAILVNSTYRDSLKDLFYTNTELLYKNKKHLDDNELGFSYGLTLMNDEEQDEKNIQKLFDIIDTFPKFLKNIRVGLAVPYSSSDFSLLNYNKIFKSFVTRLFNKDKNFKLHFDCATNNCQISPRLMGECMEDERILDFKLNCNDCIFEVLADGKVVYCFACPKDFLTIDSYKRFPNSEDVRVWYRNRVQDYMEKYWYQCMQNHHNRDCQNDVCKGVCIAINEHLRLQHLKHY
jgi:organic radical activating enzyme